MTTHIRRLFLFFILLPSFSAWAQTPTKTESEYERYVRQQQASFQTFAERREQEMDSLRQAANKAFNAMLNREWKEAESKKISSPYPRPKPVEPPRAEEKKQGEVQLVDKTKKEKTVAPNRNRENEDRVPAEESKPKKAPPIPVEPAQADLPEVKTVPEQKDEQTEDLSAFRDLGLENVQAFGWDWYMPSITPGFDAPQGPINDKTIAAAYARWSGSDQAQLRG